MNGPSSDITLSNDDDKNLEWLLEVFGSKISHDDMASAYYQAGRDINKTNEILKNMLGSSSSNNTPVGPVNGGDYARSSVVKEPPKVLYGKSRKSGMSMGTVSGVIGADYGKSRSSNKEVYESSKPAKLMSSEIPASQIWGEMQKPVNGKNETMNKDIEVFLLKMLGDGFQLDMEVIKKVVGGCGYDVQESLEKLMNMSTPNLDLGNATSSTVDQTGICHKLQDLEINTEEKQQFRDLTRNRSNLEKEILSKLFTNEVKLGIPSHPKREPRTRKFGVVTGPLEEPVIEFKNPIVKQEDNGNGNGESEDNYDTLREAAKEHWITMKQYYRAAAEAFVKGDYELADKFNKQGHFFMDKAKEANETSAKMLTETRNDAEVISVDLNSYDPKDALRLMKSQLRSMCGIPSYHHLKAMVGPSADKTKPNARKHLICKLLKRDEIKWTEEDDGQTLVIRIDVINPKTLSFNKK